MRGVGIAGVGVLTAWGDGVGALPADAREAAGGRGVLTLATPARPDERFRRATRECLIGIAAVEALLRDAGLGAEAIAGNGTALVYVTAAAYAASNRAFIQPAATGGALHFPYTAPSAVPAEVAIAFGLTGRYVILIGGPTATVDALWHASDLVARGVAERALVLAVETFAECADLWTRAHRVIPGPMTEAAACALLVPGEQVPTYSANRADERGEPEVRRRAGQTLACEPLIALALGRARGADATSEGYWRGRRAAMAWPRATTATRAAATSAPCAATSQVEGTP